MAITDNKIINGSGLSELSSQIKSYVNGKIVNEVYVGDTAPTDPKAKLWVDTSAEPSNNSYTKSEIDTKLTQKQDTLTPGDNITIVNGVISSTASGSAEPDAYIKDASVSGNTLTLTKKDDTEVVFTPSGGSGGDIKIFAFSSTTGNLTDQERENLQYCVDNLNNVIFTIDNELVVSAKWQWNNWFFVCLSYDNAEEVVKEYVIGTINNSTTITGSKIGSNKNAILITNNNINNFSSSWRIASDMSDSSLYNARELAILFENSDGKCFSYYYNFNCSFDSAWDTGGLGMYANKNFYIQVNDNTYYQWYYDGSMLHLGSSYISNYRIYYKT